MKAKPDAAKKEAAENKTPEAEQTSEVSRDCKIAKSRNSSSLLNRSQLTHVSVAIPVLFHAAHYR